MLVSSWKPQSQRQPGRWRLLPPYARMLSERVSRVTPTSCPTADLAIEGARSKGRRRVQFGDVPPRRLELAPDKICTRQVQRKASSLDALIRWTPRCGSLVRRTRLPEWLWFAELAVRLSSAGCVCLARKPTVPACIRSYKYRGHK